MYLPQHFEETRVEELHRIITEYPLGVLVINGPHGLDANHLPFELNPNAGPRGHLLGPILSGKRSRKMMRRSSSSVREAPIFRQTGFRANMSSTGKCRHGIIKLSTSTARSRSMMTSDSYAVLWLGLPK